MMHPSMLLVVEEMPVMEVLGAAGKVLKARARSARLLSRRAHRLGRLVAPRVMVIMKIYKRALMELRSRTQCTDPQQALSAAI